MHAPSPLLRPIVRRLCLAGVLSLLACGDVPAEDPSGLPLEVRVLYSLGGKGDHGFADRVYEGLVRAQLRFDFSTLEHQPVGMEEAEAVFANWLQSPLPPEGESLIVLVGMPYVELVEARDCAFEGHRLLFLDAETGPCPDLHTARFDTFEPSFLAGLVAEALVGEGRGAGAVGGMELPVVDEFIEGFEAGVRFQGGRVFPREYFGASFENEEEGFWNRAFARERADALFDDVDLLFAVAGGANQGVIEAAKERGERDEARYVIATDSDQASRGHGVVVGSVLKRLDRVLEERIEALRFGSFPSGPARYGLAGEYVELRLAPSFAERVKASLLVEGRDAAIEAGERWRAGSPLP